jgi:tetratricopeptide (TPR) repeat protein
MSLLIKALDKAQNAKTEQVQAENEKAERTNAKQKQTEKGKAKDEVKTETSSDLELSLSPTGSALAEPSVASPTMVTAPTAQNVTQTSSQIASQVNSQTNKTITAPLSKSTATNSPKNAANVFSAKGAEAANQNTRLALIGGAGLVALLGMGLYFYQFVDNTPDVVIPPRPLEQVAIAQQPESSAALPEIQAAEAPMPQAFEPDETLQLAEQQEAPIKKMAKKQTASDSQDEVVVGESTSDEMIVESNEADAPVKTNKKGRKSKSLQFGEVIASPSASISVTKTAPQASVNPTLMSAYEAYNAGKDAEAQKLYKQVLQHDVRNVDALLGLGAIASRQGRDADANGWYNKVLEIDPRNNIAQAALLDSQLQGNEENSESRIKNMLARHPDDVNLHVALGNLYAEQNQWPAAQQAYFDAYSLKPNADNAFNLAVSLDQMGKPKLALPYYQRALAQASTTSSIDKAALEARIAAIQ